MYNVYVVSVLVKRELLMTKMQGNLRLKEQSSIAVIKVCSRNVCNVDTRFLAGKDNSQDVSGNQ